MDSQKWDLKIREDVDRIHDKIIMLTNNHKNAHKIILLVEGKYDMEFYRKFVVGSNVLVFYTYGCERMNALAEILRNEEFEYLAIQDSDFANLGTPNSGMVNMFFTDAHDYEMTSISNRAIWGKFDSALELTTHGISEQDIYDEIETLSFYRYCSRVNDFYNDFKIVSERVCSEETMDYQFVHDHIGNSHPRFREVVQGFFNGFVIANQHVKNAPYDFHNGHDVLNRIVYKINHTDDHPCEGYDEVDLQEILAECTTLAEFKNTTLYQDIKKWEKTHAKVFN